MYFCQVFEQKNEFYFILQKNVRMKYFLVSAGVGTGYLHSITVREFFNKNLFRSIGFTCI